MKASANFDPEYDISNIQRLLSVSPGMLAKDMLLILKLADRETLWRAALDLQFNMVRYQELLFLSEYSNYKQSENILEIGFGVENVIGGIAPYFPGKVDNVVLNFNYLFAGKNNYKNIVNEIESQLKNSSKKYDNIQLRLVSQHVNQFGALIKSIGKFLKKDGNIIIMESYDSYLSFGPDIPIFASILSILTDVQEEKGGTRTAADKIHRKASLYGFSPIKKSVRAVRSHEMTDIQNFYRFFLYVSEVLNRLMGGKIDQLKLIREMNHWVNSNDAFGQFGIQFVELKKV